MGFGNWQKVYHPLHLWMRLQHEGKKKKKRFFYLKVDNFTSPSVPNYESHFDFRTIFRENTDFYVITGQELSLFFSKWA